jgi:hypothetical protein
MAALVRADPARASAELLAMAARLRTQAAMAAELGVCRRQVIRWCKILGISHERARVARTQGGGNDRHTPLPPRAVVALYKEAPPGVYQAARELGDGPWGWLDVEGGERVSFRLGRFPGGGLRLIVVRGRR